MRDYAETVLKLDVAIEVSLLIIAASVVILIIPR